MRRPQDESEQPAKVYQLDAVENKVDTAIGKLDAILKQTSGVVTRKQMEDYVQKEINDAVAPLVAHKNNVLKLGWTMLTLVIADIATRLFGFPK